MKRLLWLVAALALTVLILMPMLMSARYDYCEKDLDIFITIETPDRRLLPRASSAPNGTSGGSGASK